MSIPGIGAVTATSFVAAIEDPANFRNSQSVGARVGLTTRRYQSGEVDYDGHTSRRGDRPLRWLLYEAAALILTRVRSESSLRTRGLGLSERIGFERAAVAFAGQTVLRTVYRPAAPQKLAVIMHAMLSTGVIFDPQAGAAT